MARLAHVIRFRCEVIALTRLVTVRLAWALTLHCCGSSHMVMAAYQKAQPVRGQDWRLREPSPLPLLFRRLAVGRWREIERLAAG
jgi:hypothetical protein